MFEIFKKRSGKELAAVTDGKCIPLEQVNDPAFAGKTMGDGIAIIPEKNVIVAPCDGVLTMVATTRHAFGMTREDGLEIMVHIGIDTVALQGEGFTVHAEAGASLKKGEPVISYDEQMMKERGIDMSTMLILLNQEDYEVVEMQQDAHVQSGTDAVIKYRTKV